MHARFAVCLLVAAGAQAQEADPPSVVVLGHGQTRQVQNVTRADLMAAVPGGSPLKILEKLPGVSFQSADALGAYEWSTRISIRGYSQGQLGFTLDGVPLGNMSYGNNNGLHISRAIIAENLQRADLSQGAGSAGTASTSNLGGTVQFHSAEPAQKPTLAFSQSAGSNSARRTFARVDSGQFGAVRASLAAVHQHALKWKGMGPQDQDQVNARVVADIGDHSLEVSYNYSDRSENDYQDMSPDMQRRLGWDWDNYAPDWQRTLDAAGGKFSGGVNNLDDAYYTARGMRIDHLAWATLKLALPVAVNSTVYHHSNKGQGHWYTPYQATSPTMPISIRTTDYTISRRGLTSALEFELGSHTISAGLWFEHNGHLLTRNFFAVTGPEDTNRFLTNPFFVGFQQHFTTRTRQFHVQDSARLLDNKLKLEAALKWSRVTIDTTSMNAARAAGPLKADPPVLPQVGVSYVLAEGRELFASASKSYRSFEPGVYGPFSQNQAAFDSGGKNLRPERATSTDLGYRFRGPLVSGSLAVYRADFSDRIVSVAACIGVVGCPNTVVNVGKVATRGVEAAAVFTPSRTWTWFNSLTYNDSRYRTDYMDAGKLVAVSGKRVVDSPKLMVGTELAYEQEPWTWRVNAKYTGSRFYTYLNDAGVPSYAVAGFSAGYKLGEWGGLHDLQLRAHVNNVFNKRYFATLGSNQFVASDPNGLFPTLLVGAPREFLLSLSGRLGR
jgi:iron complex outermembrane receptor protein